MEGTTEGKPRPSAGPEPQPQQTYRVSQQTNPDSISSAFGYPTSVSFSATCDRILRRAPLGRVRSRAGRTEPGIDEKKARTNPVKSDAPQKQTRLSDLPALLNALRYTG